MTWPDDFFFPDVIDVQDHLGTGSMGDRFGVKRRLSAETIDVQQLVRGPDGREVVSSSRVTVPIVSAVPVGSIVTVWPGGTAEREARVLRVGRDENPPPLPSHLILWLE